MQNPRWTDIHCIRSFHFKARVDSPLPRLSTTIPRITSNSRLVTHDYCKTSKRGCVLVRRIIMFNTAFISLN